MATDADRLLSSWSGSPTPAKAIALCDVLRAALSVDPAMKARVASVGPAVVGRHGDEPEVLVALGRLYLAAEELLRADAVLKRALELAPADARPLRLLGEVFLSAGNARDAEKAFEGAIARGMGDRETAAWLGRARSYLSLQDSGGASAVASAIARGLWSPPDNSSSGRAAAANLPPSVEEEEPTTSSPRAARGPLAPSFEPVPSSSGADVATALRPFTPDLTALARSGPSLPSPDSARTLVHPRPAGREVPRPKPTLRSAMLEAEADDEPEPPTAARHESSPAGPISPTQLAHPRELGAGMQVDALSWGGGVPESTREMDMHFASLQSSGSVQGLSSTTPASEQNAHVMAMPALVGPGLHASSTLPMPAQPARVRDEAELASTDRHPAAMPRTPRMLDAPVAVRGNALPAPNPPLRGNSTEPMFGGLPPVPTVPRGSGPMPIGPASPSAANATSWRPPQVVEVAVPRRQSRSPLVPLLFAAVVVLLVTLVIVYFGFLRGRSGPSGARHASGAEDAEVAYGGPLEASQPGGVSSSPARSRFVLK